MVFQTNIFDVNKFLSRAIIKSKYETSADLAAATNLNLRTIKKAKLGKSQMTLNTFLTILNVLGYNEIRFSTGTGYTLGVPTKKQLVDLIYRYPARNSALLQAAGILSNNILSNWKNSSSQNVSLDLFLRASEVIGISRFTEIDKIAREIQFNIPSKVDKVLVFDTKLDKAKDRIQEYFEKYNPEFVNNNLFNIDDEVYIRKFKKAFGLSAIKQYLLDREDEEGLTLMTNDLSGHVLSQAMYYSKITPKKLAEHLNINVSQVSLICGDVYGTSLEKIFKGLSFCGIKRILITETPRVKIYSKTNGSMIADSNIDKYLELVA